MPTDQPRSQMGQSVGAKLRAARQAKRYTQGQLAAPDFSVSYISAIERGQIHPSLRALEILARRLDLSSTDFLPEHSQSHADGKAFTSTPPNEEESTDVTLLEAQIAILQGEPQQALKYLATLTPARLHKFQKMHYRYLLGWAYLLTNQLQEALLALDEAKSLAIEQNNTYSSLHTHNLLGLVYAAMHNHQQALQSHQRCLALLESNQLHDPFFSCHVYSHMGQHYIHLNDFPSAIEMFQQATALAEQLTELEQKQLIYGNISQHYAQVGNYRQVALYAYKHSHLSQQQRNTALRSEMYHYLGRAMMMQDQTQARTYLEEALQRESNGHDLLTQASITIHLAEWFLLHNELQEAEKYTQHAFTLAQSFGDTIIAVEVHLMLGRICYMQAKYDEGDTHFVAALQMLERLHMYDELSDQSAFYAQLLDERNKPHEAITYYKRAIESRRKSRHN